MSDFPYQFPAMHPSSLVLRKGKWYVAVTVPKELEAWFKQKQIRRSTGTIDKTLARQKQHKLTHEIYDHLQTGWMIWRDALLSEFKTGWEIHAIALAKALGIYSNDFEPTSYRLFLDQKAKEVCKSPRAFPEDVFVAVMDYIGWESADEEEWKLINDLAATDEPAKVLTKRHTGTNTVLGLLPDYIGGRNWNREATRKGAEGHIKVFADLVGNLQIDKIEKAHAYDFAKALAGQGKANRTIKTTVSSVTAFLTWCEQERLIAAAPFHNLKLSNYGTPTQKYKPLTTDELTALFKLDMPKQDRLLLSILVTTGMRLDEAALLTWQRMKTVDGIACFDLTDYEEAITIKNKQSLRLVPIPNSMKLPASKLKGPLFTYRRGDDGKAEGAASKALMKHIRAVTTDKRKVVHSLRGNLKDMLRDANISKELSDFITGHGSKDEGGKYGAGHSLMLKADALNQIEHPWLK